MTHLPKLGLILAAAVLSLPLSAAAHPGMRGYGAPASPVRHVVVNYDNGAVIDEHTSAYASNPLPCARSYREDDYGATRTVDVSPDRPTYGGACWLPRDTVETIDVRAPDSRASDPRDVVYDNDMPPPPPPPPGAVPCTCVMTGGGYAYEARRPVEVRREIIVREAPRRESYQSGHSDAYGSTYEESYSESSESYDEVATHNGRVVYSNSYDSRSDDRYEDGGRRDDRDHYHHGRHHDRGHGRGDDRGQDRHHDRQDDRAHHDIWFNRY